jgi:hypothetical protein
VVFGVNKVISQAINNGFQSLIGFWVVFGYPDKKSPLQSANVSIPNRVLGGFRMSGSGWLEV